MAFWSAAPTAFEDPAKDALLKQRCSLAEIRREVAELRGHLDKLDSPIAFCHNDLLCKNILFDADAGTPRHGTAMCLTP
jgi:ethanolamine kinase